MAGKRQHFVPQFLQRGFVSHVEGNETFTWVHRKDTQPFNTNIKNAGVEGFFYSVRQDSGLDDAITGFEREYSSLISNLRCGASQVTADTLRIAQLLAHLEMRTRHLRQSFLETSTHLLDEIMRFASDEEAFGRYFRRAIQRNNSLMQDAMAKEISGPLIERILPKILSQMSEFATQFRNTFPGTLKEAVKAGQIKAMLETLAPKIKVERFAGLEFQVLESAGPPLVLGDSIVLFQVAGERAFKPFLENDDELVAVYLPLSPQQVLVGSNAFFALDPACLRREIARCSLEHFVASEAPPEHSDLRPFIGENAHLLSAGQVETILRGLIE